MIRDAFSAAFRLSHIVGKFLGNSVAFVVLLFPVFERNPNIESPEHDGQVFQKKADLFLTYFIHLPMYFKKSHCDTSVSARKPSEIQLLRITFEGETFSGTSAVIQPLKLLLI